MSSFISTKNLTLEDKKYLALLLYNDKDRKHIFEYVRDNSFYFSKKNRISV